MIEPIISEIPPELQQWPFWNAWAAIPRTLEDGTSKVSKPPITVSWSLSKVDKPGLWTSFRGAADFYQRKKGQVFKFTDQRTGQICEGPISGIGLCLIEPSDLIGIDIDGALDENGNPPKWAAPLIKALQKTYCEYSPSGRGIRAFVHADLPGGNRRGKSVEIYNSRRFLTITGIQYPGSEFAILRGAEAQKIVERLIDHIGNLSTGGGAAPARNSPPVDTTAGGMDILEKARTSEKGAEFAALYDRGDFSAYPSQSEADLALCNQLAFWTGGNAAEMDRLFRRSALMRPKWDQHVGHGANYGEATIARAITTTRNQYQPKTAPAQREKRKGGRPKERPIAPNTPTGKVAVTYERGKLDAYVTKIQRILLGDLYQYGGILVRIARVPTKKAYALEECAYESAIIEQLNVDALATMLCAKSDWQKRNYKNELVAINPPLDALRALLAAKGMWIVDVLSGLVTSPTLRPDGSIIKQPGYDRKTGLFADFDPAEFPELPDRPTKDAAMQALETLLDAISEFPFRTDVDRSVALAGMITSVMRPSVMAAPMFAFDAPEPGTGKSTLADLVGIMATGHPCPTLDYVADEAEFKKTLFATMLNGNSIILIDNIVGEMNSSLLNQILTQERIESRILGASQTAVLDTQRLWLATGNNLTFIGDMTRRVLFCTLDSGEERPEQRRFKRNIYQWARENRGALVGAALTILRAFALSTGRGGIIADMQPYSGYDDWSTRVRGALIWLDQPDPLKSQAAIADNDPQRNAFERIISAWFDYYQDKWVTAKDLLDRSPDKQDGIRDVVSDEKMELAQALADGVPSRGELSNFVLGKWLTQNKGRIMSGLKLIMGENTHKHAKTWKIVKVKT